MKRRRSVYSRRNSNLMPTLIVLVIALVAALGGAVYWDKVQKEIEEDNTALQQQMIEEEEIRLPHPENEDSPLPTETKQDDAPVTDNTPTDPASEEEDETEPEQEDVPVTDNRSYTVPAGDEIDESYFSNAAFVGDSLTQGLQLYDILDTNVIANRGINLESIYKADKIRVAEGYTSVFAELERIQPEKIYIQLGMNDIAWRTEKDFTRLYGELIDKVQAEFPESTLYIQSIFPVTNWYAQEDNGINNTKVVTYNQHLMELAQEKGCYYLDIHSVLINENGALDDAASPDGIHLNAPYYKEWFQYLKTHTVP